MQTPRFDEWTGVKIVDCNNCEEYWTNTCDGVPNDTERNCTAFKATRKVVIPMKLEDLEKRLKELKARVVALYVMLIVYMLTELIFSYV